MRRTALAALLVAALAPAAAAQGAGSSPAAEATVTGPTGAATEGALAPLLARSHQHPAVLAAQAALDAARAQLQAARSPVRLEVTGGVTRLDVDEIDVNPLEPGVQPLERTLLNASAGVTFRPFAFGDIADLVDQREVAVAQAELDLRSALVSVQVRTLEAALQLELARAGVAVAEEGAALAREALAATELRASRGAATERDLREARSGVAEAESLVADAHSSLELAELSLRTLLGDGEPPAVDPAAFDLPLPEGEPVEVIRAGLQARLAELAPRGAQRALLPVAQASYAFNLGEHDTLTLSLESRTLQPGVTFTHDAIGRSFPQTEVRGALTVGVAWSISPESFDALRAAEAQLEAARLALEAARQGAALQERALIGAAEQAQRALELARARRDDAEARLAETRARVDAGLATPLELQADALALTRAELELRSASLGALRSTLDLYELYALPLTAAPEASAR